MTPPFALYVLSGRRTAITAVSAVIASTWLVVAAVVVVAAGATPPPAELAAGLAIPAAAVDAYEKAATASPGAECGLRWQILAGIGRVESNHASGHTIDADGSISPPILGIALDGSAGVARVADTDGGRLDGDTTYDRAVGPMQFLPASWQLFGADGNGDGRADPNNLSDAAVAAGAHLCAARIASLERDDALEKALRSYNHRDAYVADVQAWIHYYDAANGLSTPPQPAGAIVDVQGTRVDASIAGNLAGLLAAAQQEGLNLSGAGYRTGDDQIALRRAHCGSSDYAVFEMPADGCSPPTARPGQSMHESGLAIDFTCNGALVSRLDPCFALLTTHAAAYGLFNLPTEPWHWSTTGR
ncbi:MAG TPA: D-alanyl-D-alanine carboxypeptidase family protein [Acidimicrobiales bacterium]|nr:D-alanyl-D-alanine carboxypeptidase family protein [Acidimicrobiales bacterium]